MVNEQIIICRFCIYFISRVILSGGSNAKRYDCSRTFREVNEMNREESAERSEAGSLLVFGCLSYEKVTF